MASLSREKILDAIMAIATVSAVIGIVVAISLNARYRFDPATSLAIGSLVAIAIFTISVGEGAIVMILWELSAAR